jgi:hypothetical protein
MATGKIIGQIEATSGGVKVIGVDGALRGAVDGGFVYDGEQVVSIDANSLFQIKYLALPEAATYDGIFRVLANGSVISGTEAMDSIASDEDLIDLLETAAGEEGAEGSSAYIPTDVVADSSVQDFSRGPNPAVLGLDGVEVDGTMEGLANRTPAISVDGANDVVYESGLSAGTDATANTEFAYGTFTVSDPDGLNDIQSVTINGVTIPTSNLGNNNIVTSAIGTLTVTSYDNTTGVAQYQYELTSNTTDVDGVTETDVFTLTTNDGTIDSAPATITIEIVDDGPSAVEDTTSTAEDTQVVYNVITNIDGTSDSSGADTPATLTVATLANTADGTLSFDSNGEVTFTPNEGVEGAVVVNYTIEDADGDTASSILTITVDEDSTPTVTANSSIVDETGGLDSDTQSLVANFYNDTGAVALSATDATWYPTTDTLLADNGAWKVVVNGNGTYTVTQLLVMEHPNATDPNDPIVVGITATATESGSADTASTSFSVTFLDDGPSLITSQNSLMTNTIGNSVSAIFDFDLGADDGSLAVTFGEPLFTTDGDPIILTKVNDGTWVGHTSTYFGMGEENNIFVLDIDLTNQTYTVDLVGPGLIAALESALAGEGTSFGSGPGNYYILPDVANVSSELVQISGYENFDLSASGLNLENANFVTDVITLATAGEVNLQNNFYGVKQPHLGDKEILVLDFTDDNFFGTAFDGPAVHSITLVAQKSSSLTWVAYDDNGNVLGHEAFNASAGKTFTVSADNGEFISYIGIYGGDTNTGIVVTSVSTLSNTGQADVVFEVVGTDGDGDVSDTAIINVQVDGSGNLTGTDASEVLSGDDNDNTIDGGAGSDALYGGLGDDTLIYDSDDSVIDGGEGVDTLIVNDGDILDLSNVSSIETVQLGENASVVASGTTFPEINATDVITVADNNTLIIHGNDTNEVNINEASFDPASPYTGGDISGLGELGVNYTYYEGIYDIETAILLIQEPIDIV